MADTPNTRTLVIENDPSNDARLLGDWLTGAGLTLETVRPHAGQALPDTLDGYAAVVVMGGRASACPAPDGTPGATWFPALGGLLRLAVRRQVPTLAVCLGAQLLADAHGGTVAPARSGPEVGPKLVGKRDAAMRDPLWVDVPMAPDVLQWHEDEITDLPLGGATLLAASTRFPVQAFRIGTRAWGVQFHIECDAAMIADWVADGTEVLDALGYDPEVVREAFEAALPDVEEAWRPFAERFAALALGTLDPGPDVEPGPGRTLPLLGGQGQP